MQVYMLDTPTKLSLLLLLLQCRGNCSANATCAKERQVLVCWQSCLPIDHHFGKDRRPVRVGGARMLIAF